MTDEDHDVPVPIADTAPQNPIEEHPVDDECNEVEPENRVFHDYTPNFTTSRRWSDCDAMIKHFCDIALGLNMVLTVKQSWVSTPKKCGSVILACEKHGTCRPRKRARVVGNDELHPNRKPILKFEGCPFALSGVEFKRGKWRMEVLNGTHNHVIPTSLEGHSFMGCLDPKQVETTEKNEARQKRTITEEGLHLLKEKGYFYVSRRAVGEVDRLHDLFLVNPKARHLLNIFPYAVIIDSTFKTNEYGIPLCEFIGFTCTGKNFNIAFCFMSLEDTDSYCWALQQLMYILRGRLPKVIVTNRELELIRALKVVLPNVSHMLCKVHVLRECEEAAFKKSKNLEVARKFHSACYELFGSRTIDTFNTRLRDMHGEWGHIKGLMSYLEVTWLRDYTKNIVCAWTDNIMHFGTRTTNRVESVHSVLKNTLHSSIGDFTHVLKAIDLVLENEMNEVKITMSQTYNIWPIDSHGLWMFDQVRNVVSKECFNLLFEIYTKMETDPPSKPCRDRYWRNVYGLPCTHEMQACRDAHTPIRPSQIHVFWKQLDWDRPCIDRVDDNTRHPRQIGQLPWAYGRALAQAHANPLPWAYDRAWAQRHANPLPWAYDRAWAQAHANRERNSGTVQGRERGRGKSSSNEQAEMEGCKEGTSLNENQLQQAEIMDDIQGVGRGRDKGRGRSRSDTEVMEEHNTTVADVGETNSPHAAPTMLDIQGVGRGRGRSRSHIEVREEHNTTVADVGETNGPHAAPTTLPEADIIHLGFNWGTNNIDEFMIGFIRAVTNVTGDGHGGYRSFACLLNMGQEAWPQVRRQLLAEL